MQIKNILCVSALCLIIVGCAKPKATSNEGQSTSPSASTFAEYAPAVKRIIDGAEAGNDAYRKMHELCDGIGHRLSGSAQLDKALAWAIATMKADRQENVHPEQVMVPRWVRGDEWARMIKPREVNLAMIGLGMSVGTKADGITAPVIVVTNEDELEAAKDKIAGKIVLFNNPMPPYDAEKGSQYGTTVRFRGKGPSLAASHGAVACLIRSVTARSLHSPHTGMTRYDEKVAKIPAAAISVEDAEMISRMVKFGQEVVLCLKMDAHMEGNVPSANVIGELRGTTWPEEIVVIGGHIDSWDAGQGAHDDAGGCVAAMEAINILRKLNMIPKRTIRVVLWTNEENGLAGGKQYAKDHAEELARHVAAIESDGGTFAPIGFGVECSDPAKQARAARQLREIAKVLAPLGIKRIDEGHSGADVSPMKSAGVPLMGFNVEGSLYFDYHHSHADTLDKIDPSDLTHCSAAMAAMAYILADMPTRLGEVTPAAQN